MKTTDAELQQLRIAVALAEGYVWVKFTSPSEEWTTLVHKDAEWPARRGGVVVAEPIGAFDASDTPNYPESRDAIIGAIVRRFVTEAEKGRFLHQFTIRCDHVGDIFALATATPEQLCRAYLSAATPPAEGQPK